MIFSFGELFCGPGGLSLGASLAGFEHRDEPFGVDHLWANDVEPWTCRTFALNVLRDESAVIHMADYSDPTDAAAAAAQRKRAVLCGKVENLCISMLPPINALAFGFPCNDYSSVGERRGMSGNYGPLYSYGIEVLRYHQPLWFIAENVTGLANSNNRSAFRKIVTELRDAGPKYRLTLHRYQFEQYGVPQTRQRIIIVGIRSDLGLTFRVPRPTTPREEQYVTARQALDDIPEWAQNNEVAQLSKAVVARLNSLEPGENAWHSRIPKEHQLNVKSARMSQIYKVLDPDRPAYTVTGSGGGGTHGYHWDKPRRALTNRERARLQTFPDDFVFRGGRDVVRRQIGMAVPPMGAKIIIESILKTFAGIDYPWVEATWEVSVGSSSAHLRRRKAIWQTDLPLDLSEVDGGEESNAAVNGDAVAVKAVDAATGSRNFPHQMTMEEPATPA